MSVAYDLLQDSRIARNIHVAGGRGNAFSQRSRATPQMERLADSGVNEKRYWQPLAVNPGWQNSSLRIRRLNNGTSLQITGRAEGGIASGARTAIGTLPPDYRPSAVQNAAAIAIGSGINAYGLLSVEVTTAGTIEIIPQIAMAQAGFNVTITLD